ncbi:hypothetical protein EPUS_08250 [Endocarpon pusillum Z07020]|uniref:2,4-dienoyl-CoA reductase [(3E)-enoyl-CoA-producing] n=1 Tax=Endocarpon pusillum (strain Z07020 / HMAS-L-300199) TaxID=1263415 RepID=U1GVB5_ENDPU|nr:uncharacterized protein EPUS_08250 [Endocarpon pusillum Z07020]ERF75996.1 hypothetical protein EPUS_08250 [Endocarpon pusillum Z07020]
MAMKRSDYLSEVWREGIFNNKVVFCTGGNGTICSAQVRAMVHLGANACIVGRNVEKTESMARSLMTAREGSKVLGIGSVDVRNPESLNQAVESCVKELGGIDFCIAGAAGNFLSPLSHLSANAFKSVIDIDVLGSYNTAKAVLPHLVKSASTSTSGGRLIFVSATIHYTGAPLQTHVAVAKAGVDALSANVAIEYGPRGLTSNVIAPGPIAATEGMERLSRGEDAQASRKRIPAVGDGQGGGRCHGLVV